ncbi:MAG: class I SAM-dependent methyltransferase [Bryobacterales bacterium]|nr:class I SAM-dependent methyltransferase [Bryobacterales bacterium]
MKVLDVACGPGNAARTAARAGARTTGLGFVPKPLQAGKSKAEGPEMELRVGDAGNLPFEDRSFDRVRDCNLHLCLKRDSAAGYTAGN